MSIQSSLHAFTIAPFCLAFVPPQNRTTTSMLGAIATALLCTLLPYLSNNPIMPLSLAVAFLVWTCLPGSFADLKLPSHTTFMRNLGTANNEAEDECKICWTSENSLAIVPCGHVFCTKCLRTMGEYFQTACPQCRTPLFSTYDHLVFVVSKGSVACAMMNAILFLLQGGIELWRGDYRDLAISGGSIYGMVWYIQQVWMMIFAFGNNWWRGAPRSTNWAQSNLTPLTACLAFWTGIVLLWQTTGTTGRMLQ